MKTEALKNNALNFPAITIHDKTFEAARNEVLEFVASGTLSVESPFDGMHNAWSDIDKQNLKITLSEMFNWKHAV
jgi:hypothetical protein